MKSSKDDEQEDGGMVIVLTQPGRRPTHLTHRCTCQRCQA